MNSKKVFISYSHADLKFASKLAKNLHEHEVDVWMDKSKIPAGKRWDQSIEEAIIKSDVVLFILSPSSVKSQIAMDEVSFALEEEMQIVPILYKQCQIPFRLRRIQRINFLAGYDVGYKKLLETLNVQGKPREKDQANDSDENTKEVFYKAPLKVPRILPESTDDPAFLLILEKILTAIIFKNSPINIFIIRIDNWFDHKWLNFSGMGKLGTKGIGESETKLVEFYPDQITLPPFNPNRVVSQYNFEKGSKGLYLQKPFKNSLHRKEKMSSGKNLHRRIVSFAKSSLFFWFSSNSAGNQKGTIMAYQINEQVLTWFCSFTSANSKLWTIERIKGITKNEMESFLVG